MPRQGIQSVVEHKALAMLLQSPKSYDTIREPEPLISELEYIFQVYTLKVQQMPRPVDSVNPNTTDVAVEARISGQILCGTW